MSLQARGRRPSPPQRPRLGYANVMSTIAVFAVLGGGAYAAGHRIGTDDIQNRAVTTAKLDRQAVGTGKLKPRAVGTGKLRRGAVTAGKLRPALQPRWAVVSSVGGLLRGRGAIDAERISEGNYNVEFDRDLRACSAVVSVGGPISGIHTSAGTATATPGFSGSDNVRVSTRDLGGELSNGAFHLQVAC